MMKTNFWNAWPFSPKRMAQRLGVYCGIMKNSDRKVTWNIAQRRAGKQKTRQSASNKGPVTKPLGPNGTEIIMVSGKAGRETNPPHPEQFMQLFDNLANIIDFGYHFCTHWILKGGPNINRFWNTSEKQVRKVRSKKRDWKNTIA